jgi:predicted metal-dependent phosphoesterase TrpH
MKKEFKADLHLHSCFSDGELTPGQLAEKCAETGLEVISLTDHDTVEGVSEMIGCAKEFGMECFSGIELSTLYSAEIHILGYNFDIEDEGFKTALADIRRHRAARVNLILQKLNDLGINITKEEVNSNAEKSRSVGRVHIAKTLVSKKYVSSVKEAFDKLLMSGKAAYVPSSRIETEKAIKIIKSAGGKAVLAHPFLINIDFKNLLPLISLLKEWGLDGIETQYYTHNNFETDFLRKTADKLGLISTCGSDYHGSLRVSSDISGYMLSREDYTRLMR